MASKEDIAHQKNLLTIHRRNLAHYLGQQAAFGTAFTPPVVAHGITEARSNIQRIKGILRGWGIIVDDHPDDAPDDASEPSATATASPQVPVTGTEQPSGRLLQYQEFEVRISRAENDQYLVEVLRSPEGEARALTRLPIDRGELRTQLAALRLPLTEREQLVEIGSILHDFLFNPPPIARAWAGSLGSVQVTGQGLNLRLRIEDTELAQLPWELLYDQDRGRFLIPSLQTPLLRYIPMPEPVLPLSIRPPLRILLAISSPPDYPALDVEREKRWVLDALSPLFKQTKSNTVSVDILEPTTRQTLQTWLRRDYHVLHYIGHGHVDSSSGTGSLVLTDETTQHGRPQDAETLGYLLRYSSIRLVFLNACQTAVTSGTEAFLGVAQAIVRAGMPAVVAMQFDIPDTSAAVLAREFYRSLADGYSVQAAVTEGRKAVLAQIGLNYKDWATPALFMRSPTGVLFDPRSGPAAQIRLGDVTAGAVVNEQGKLTLRDTPEDQRSGGSYEIRAQDGAGAVIKGNNEVIRPVAGGINSLTESLRLKLRVYRDNLERLETKAAMESGEHGPSPSLLEEIKFVQAEIRRLEEELATPPDNQDFTKLKELREILVTQFSVEELYDLCFDLGVDFENLRGDGKSAKAREMIAYFQRRRQLDQLINSIRRQRPDIDL